MKDKTIEAKPDVIAGRNPVSEAIRSKPALGFLNLSVLSIFIFIIIFLIACITYNEHHDRTNIPHNA